MKLRLTWAPLVTCFLLMSALCGVAQGPQPRLKAAISGDSRVVLPGTRPGQAARGVDQGAVAAAMPLKGVTLVFSRTAAQQADLDTLLAAQANPSSALYHHWLTPDEFATRFGVADSDIATVESWLQSQGFAIDSVARSRNQITFDGTAGEVAAAFGTTLHRYQFPDRVHFAPSTDLSVPAALAPLVADVMHLSDFVPRAHKLLRKAGVQPAYTSSVSPGNHYLTPLDVATMYDMKSTYNAGFNGAGQAIAIVGESSIDMSSITAFQAGAGLKSNLPNMVLVPSTGVPGINALSDGDEGESQLDVEYATGMAPGANIFLVYTGDSPNHNVFDSLQYAVTEDIAPIISGSYGTCETFVSSQSAVVFSQIAQQAATQGQTILFSAGDNGSTDCFGQTTNVTQEEALAVDFPGSVPLITALGGTEMQTGTYSATNTQYWQSANGTDVISSLLSYVPEAVWNEDNTRGISSGGGGASVLYTRPTWQAGVAGLPAGTNRLVPDLSLQSSVSSPGYIYCTTDPSDLDAESLTNSCANGLRSSSGYFAVAGGTSFATPIMAGMLAVLNQAKGISAQGSINATLYGLASNSATYASAFHDVTTGSNACTAGVNYCSGTATTLYQAGSGYDEATGLGSIDFANLVAAWPAAAGAAPGKVASTTSLTAATLTPASGATDVVTITVNSSGATTPTGTVTLIVDGGSATSVTLSGGKASFTYPGTTVGGSHVVVAAYSGDGATLPSRGTVSLTLAGSTTPSGSFSLTSQPITLFYNGEGQGTIAVTPAAGYTGTVVFSLSYPASAPTLCYQTTSTQEPGASNFTLGGGTGASGVLLMGEGTACTTTGTGAVVLSSGQKTARLGHSKPLFPGSDGPGSRVPEGIALAGLAGFGLTWRKRRKSLSGLSGSLLMAGLALGLGLGISGCGGGSAPTTTTPVNQLQTVTVTLTGVDSVNPAISASTTFALTIHP